MDVLSTDKLTEMNVSDFRDYVKLMPSVSTSTSQGAYSPGFGQVSMRGVTNGSNGNHSGPQPSVGIYLDEEPITTIVGAIDPHIYDIARIETLAGPQGTLYGASSEAGTIRIITNKPDPTAFSASASVEVNSIDGGGIGYLGEGYVNLPITPAIALRAVGWERHDAGYIDNVYGTRTYPVSGVTENNAESVRNNYNTADTRGARAALKIDLDDNWSVTPTVLGQSQNVNGIYAYDPKVGVLEVSHKYPETSEDRWIQSALTVQGKIGNFDVVYAFSHLNRDDHYEQDYTDYSYWYDVVSSYGSYIHDNSGNLISPAQHIYAADKYRKTSNELRLSSPKEWRFRFVVGAFDQRQSHDILQQYLINNLGTDISVPGFPNTWWLTRQLRTDNDRALFGEMSFDFTDQLTGTLGGRWFHVNDGLKGFFGFNDPDFSSTGMPSCFPGATPYKNGPCLNLDKDTGLTDTLGRANLTYKFAPDKMIYATWSQGFRPGGVNRRSSVPPYKADFLDNYEFGWKTEWMDHHLRWNGAVFEERWKDPQIAYLGQNGLTEIHNAKGARIRGLETNLQWAATYNLTLSAGVAFYHSEITSPYCEVVDANDNPITDCANPEAPKGAQLPITAKQKGDVTARYTFDFHGWDSYFQAAGFFEGRRRSDLRTADNNLLGDMPGYGTVDLSIGGKRDKWAVDFYLKNAFDNRGQLAEYAECRNLKANSDGTTTPLCGAQPYLIPVTPRMIGVRVTRDF